jgi:hypothetical protein
MMYSPAQFICRFAPNRFCGVDVVKRVLPLCWRLGDPGLAAFVLSFNMSLRFKPLGSIDLC